MGLVWASGGDGYRKGPAQIPEEGSWPIRREDVSLEVFRMRRINFYVANRCPTLYWKNLGIWNSENPGAMRAISFSGEFLDLTHPSDFEFVLNKLQ